VVHDAGFPRVANLIQQQAAIDDEAIRRDAERQLAKARSLDGCRFAVTCERGVLKVNATIQSDLQEDATRLVLKQIQGVKNVQATFAKF
jgi:osmotically-inducible protein OsmY